MVTGVAALTPDMAGHYGEEELDQLVRGFGSVLQEALAGDSRDRLELFVGSAIPALMADGRTRDSLMRGVASVAVIVSTSLVRETPIEQKDEAVAWLAGFFGEYAYAVSAEAARVEGGDGL